MLSYQMTADEIVRADPELAILPIGSIEQHGPHLPVCTDWYIANALGKGVAELTGGFLLPSLPISTCRENSGKKGTVWMDPDHFYHMLTSILLSLKEQGFKKVATLQCHGGIFIMTPIIRQVNATHNPGFMVANVDYGMIPPLFPVESPVPGQFEIHAGDEETSIMLHIAPETVKMELAEAGWPTVPQPYLSYGSIFRASPNGVWGDPTQATAEKGRQILEYRAKAMAAEIERAFAYMEAKEKFGYTYF